MFKNCLIELTASTSSCLTVCKVPPWGPHRYVSLMCVCWSEYWILMINRHFIFSWPNQNEKSVLSTSCISLLVCCGSEAWWGLTVTRPKDHHRSQWLLRHKHIISLRQYSNWGISKNSSLTRAFISLFFRQLLLCTIKKESLKIIGSD